MNKNIVVWFEIPVKDLSRATKFYSTVLALELQEMQHDGMNMAFFPHAEGSVTGALVEDKENAPSEKGSLVYFNGGDDLTVPLGRIEKAGGTVVMGKTSIGPWGFIAIFKDTEGNRVALHSMK